MQNLSSSIVERDGNKCEATSLSLSLSLSFQFWRRNFKLVNEGEGASIVVLQGEEEPYIWTLQEFIDFSLESTKEYLGVSIYVSVFCRSGHKEHVKCNCRPPRRTCPCLSLSLSFSQFASPRFKSNTAFADLVQSL